MKDNARPIVKSRRPSWRVKALGSVLMVVVVFGVLELSAYLYMRSFTGYDGKHLMNYEFDDYKNIRLTPDYRNSRGVFHNHQGFVPAYYLFDREGKLRSFAAGERGIDMLKSALERVLAAEASVVTT